jgi:hypothetical protein
MIKGIPMSLSSQSIEILLDLLEIKIGYMHVHDRDDAKELLKLRYCRQELLALDEELKQGKKTKDPAVVRFPRGALRILRRKKTTT